MQRISNFLEEFRNMIVIQKFSRGQFFSSPVETGLVFQGRENWAAECGIPIFQRVAYSPHHSPTQLSLDSSDSWLSTIEAFVGARVEGIGELDPAETWTPTRLEEKEKERRRVAWKIYRRVTPAAHPPSSPPRIPSRRLSSQENLHFSLIVLHQRACVIET